MVKIHSQDVARWAYSLEAGANTTGDVNRYATGWIALYRAQVDEWLRAAREAAA